MALFMANGTPFVVQSGEGYDVTFDGLTADFCLFSALEIGGFAVTRSEVPYAVCCDQWGERVVVKPEF